MALYAVDAQEYVDAVIDAATRETGIEPAGEIDWRSPLESDGFAEYWDSVFLDRLGIHLERRPLKEFWPRSGPHWDGLARCGDSVFLVEAKAHVSELDSSPCGAQPKSRRRIEDAMSQTRAFLWVRSETDWTRCLCQYANRLAHLYLLRDVPPAPPPSSCWRCPTSRTLAHPRFFRRCCRVRHEDRIQSQGIRQPRRAGRLRRSSAVVRRASPFPCATRYERPTGI